MKKIRKIMTLVMIIALGAIVAGSFKPTNILAEDPNNIGVIDETAVPDWVVGHEDVVKQKFIDAYTDAALTKDPLAKVIPHDFGKARVGLVQYFGTTETDVEAMIVLNELEGEPLVVTDIVAIATLHEFLEKTDEWEKSLLLDIVESGGETYYVTENRDLDGIFKVVDGEPKYLDLRIGTGAVDYGDVTFVDYTKAYKLASTYMESLGLPLTAVIRQRYTTADLSGNGRYTNTTSEKEHTAQQFENGWIISARIRILNEDETLGNNVVVQHGAAPILNDMYAAVKEIADNDTLNVTGAPVSLEFTIDGVRYQNFEYGYVKLVDDVAEFTLDKVVDTKGTEMSRIIGAHEHFNNLLGAGYNIVWDKLRVGQNFRNTMGEIIRSGVAIGEPVHTIHEDGGNMAVQKFDIPGRARMHVIQGTWYAGAYEIDLAFDHHNQPLSFWQNKNDFGAPIATPKTYLNVRYQEYLNAVVYKDLGEGSNKFAVIKRDDLATWLDGAESIEAALLAKDIAQENHTVVFKDHDGTVLKTEEVEHGKDATAPEGPEREHYIFDKWNAAYDNILWDKTVTAQYNPVDYDITYILDGGINDEVNPVKANITSNILLLPANKEDYVFEGWFLDAEFKTEVTHLKEIKADTTVYARFVEPKEAEEMVGTFATGTVPGWILGSEAEIKNKFLEAYNLASFTASPTEYVKSVDLGKTRVMIYQVIPDEGAIIMNERDGSAIVVNNYAVVSAYLATLNTENASILLGVVENGAAYFVTDKGIFYFEGADIKYHEYSIGVGTDIAPFHDLEAGFEVETVLNDFSIAYKFAEHFMASLGLPTSEVKMADYTTVDLNGANGKPLGTTSAKKYYVQKFANGYIMMNSHGENIQYGAAPILKDFYDLVKEIDGNEDFSITGTPVSVEMNIEGVRHQNFEFGYVKVVDGKAVYVDRLVVDSEGYELNRRVGTPTSFINWHSDNKNRTEYLVGWERLRITQNLRNATGDLFRAGITPYKVTEADPYGDDGIHDLSSLGGGRSGVWNIYKHAEGWEALGYGNVFLLQGYWYNKPYALDPIFNVPEFVDDKDTGRPLGNSQTLYNATYQLFEKGIGYSTGLPKEDGKFWHSIKGEDFVTWMGEHTAVEDALLAHGVAEKEHTVTWYAQDGETILHTEKVAHGEAATPPEAPEIDGLVFSEWSPEDYGYIVLPNRSFTAIYGSETGQPQVGTYKFINYDTDGETADFWYEDETNVIEVNQDLYNAFRAKKLTMAESIVASGLPIYADDKNLITTLYHFQINEDGTVEKLAYTIGQLPDEIELIMDKINTPVNILVDLKDPVAAALADHYRKIIQDSFGDAYIFTWDKGGHLLGLPMGQAEVKKLYPNPDVETEYIDVIVQEFEHGFIMQEGYNNAAYSIYGIAYDKWLELGGLNGDNSLGAPTSRQVIYDEVIYQNFKYGYLKIDGQTITPKYTESVQVDFKGREIHKLAGRAESRTNVTIAHPDFEHEILRIYEMYMQKYTEGKDAGLIFDHAIEWVHEWNRWGLTQGFSPSLSSANVWGQENFTHVDLETPFTEVYIIKDEMLIQYAALSGNEGALGFPIGDSFDLEITTTYEEEEVKLDVTFQNFTYGYIRAYKVNDLFVYEYFTDAEITDEGVHMVEGEVADTPPWQLDKEDGTEINKEELQTKLTALKAERAKVKELVGDIKDLPSNQLYASKALLDEVDQLIAEVEALIANDEATNDEITIALVEVDGAITKLKNQSVPGESEAIDTPDDEEDGGMPTWGIVLAIVGSVVVVAAAAFVVYTFIIRKKK